MYLHEDEEVTKAVDALIDVCTRKGLNVTVVSADNIDDEDNVHYSSVGNTAMANTHFVAMYADYGSDIIDLVGQEKAEVLLEAPLNIMKASYWHILEYVKSGAH